MVSGVFSVARELPRLREISSVLIRYGLGDIVRRAGVSTLLERTGQVLQWGQANEVAHLEPQQRARLALEQLGPTFVKLGQMLSTREDLLPAAWTDELNRLYSQVAPVPFDDLLPQIEQALGRSPFEVFARLAEQEIPEARRYRPVDVVGQLRRSLERELDLAVEARNTERFARNFSGDLDVLVPRIYWEWTSSSMNVQEHIEGIRGDDLEAIDNAG